MKTILGEKLYTTAEIAELLGTTTTTVLNYIKAGKMSAQVIAGKKYVNEESLKSFLKPE